MGSLTHDQLVAELQRRVTQVSPGNASSAINRAIRWINRQGSFSFQLSDPASLLVTAISFGVTPIPLGMDVGKAHFIQNPNGTPIRKIGVQDSWVTANYNTTADFGFDCYTITRTNLIFFPAQATDKSCTIHFHLSTVDILGVTVANLPRDFDDLIVDMAEAEERRIYDVGDIWPLMLARVQDQIKTLLDGYRSTTQEPMPSSEAQLSIQEKTQLGRA